MADTLEPDLVRSRMAAYRAGDKEAGAQLLEIFYPELKRMAAHHLRHERSGHSWQPTVLVNELYLRLLKVRALEPSEVTGQNDRGAFFALAGQMMRRLLIDHARPLARRAQKVMLSAELSSAPESNVVEVECILSRLGEIKPELRQVVQMKVFEGLTAQEIAVRLGCSAVSVHRYWQFSRRWLAEELSI